MNADLTLKAKRAAGEAAKRRRRLNAEIKAFFTGGTLVLTGLLVAAMYGLLTHQVPL